MPQPKAPDGKWWRCPKEGCGFCHKDLYVITSHQRHFSRYHPGYTENFTQLVQDMQQIPEEEGVRWRKEHPEYYRWKTKKTDIPGIRARPRPSKIAIRGKLAANGAQNQEQSSINTIQPRPRRDQLIDPGLDSIDLMASPEADAVTPDADAMDVDVDTPAIPPPARSATPEPQYDYRWKCYVCHKHFAARSGVKTHFLSNHLTTHYIYQPNRVPKFAIEKESKKLVKLVKESTQRQYPTFTGLCVELRQLIFEQLLTISQHPEETDDVFHVQALQLAGILSVEAKDTLALSNLFVRVTVYHGDSTGSGKLARRLLHDFRAVLDPNIADMLEIEPALVLMLDDLSVQDGPKASTSFLLAYNETTFALLIRHLLYEYDEIYAISIQFRAPFVAPRHRHASQTIIRYLGYLRTQASPAVSDMKGLVDTRSLKENIDCDYSTPRDLIELLQLLVADAKDSLQSKEYSSSLATLTFAIQVWELNATPFSEDPTTWTNAHDDMYCRIHLAGCQVINSMALEAAGKDELHLLPLYHLEDAVLKWADKAFRFSVILNPFRGQAHLARGIAYKHLAKHLKRHNDVGDDIVAAQARREARTDFFFATKLLSGDEGKIAEQELTLLNYYDNTTTTAEEVGLIRCGIQYGQIFVGDSRLLEAWDGVELDRIVDRRDRPVAWE